MPVIVVTRLRLRDPVHFEEFFAAAVAVVEQANGSDGCLDTAVLADANNVFWTRTAWRDRNALAAFIPGEPHLTTMARLDDWCDEATFVDWAQTSADLPDWQASHRRLVTDGQVSNLTDPSESHGTRNFPPPVDAPLP